MRNSNRPKRRSHARIRFRKGDKVAVIGGEDKGKTGEIIKILEDKEAVLVQGANMQTKHLRKSQDNPQGGVQEVEGPIHVSKVLLYSDKLKKGVRVRFEERDGKKVRVGVPCGTVFE